MRSRFAILLTTAVMLPTACTTKSTTHVEIPSSPPFHLDAADRDALEKVGCRVDGSSVTCDAIPAGESSRARVDARRTTINEVRAHVAKSDSLDAIILGATLTVLSAGATKELGVISADKIAEDLYRTVLGYNCTAESDMKFIPAGADFELVATPAGVGTLKYSAATKQIDWHASALSETAGQVKAFVQTDGEFEFSRFAAKSRPESCFRQRASGPATAFTDRPADRRAWHCVSTAKFRDPTIQTPTWEMRFSSYLRDETKETALSAQNIPHDDWTGKTPAFTSKYVANVESAKGLLTFEIRERETNKSVLRTITPNSTPTFSIGLGDAGGDALIVQCDSQP